jgi:NAD(P)-dependent dehydrogenase (short-subunit alcohol dehydrogenase family)
MAAVDAVIADAGRLDILVNNAGVVTMGPTTEVRLAARRTPPSKCARRCAPHAFPPLARGPAAARGRLPAPAHPPPGAHGRGAAWL